MKRECHWPRTRCVCGWGAVPFPAAEIPWAKNHIPRSQRMPSAGSSTRQRILSLVPCISSLAVFFFFFLFFLLNMDGPATTSLLPYHMAFGLCMGLLSFQVRLSPRRSLVRIRFTAAAEQAPRDFLLGSRKKPQDGISHDLGKASRYGMHFSPNCPLFFFTFFFTPRDSRGSEVQRRSRLSSSLFLVFFLFLQPVLLG